MRCGTSLSAETDGAKDEGSEATSATDEIAEPVTSDDATSDGLPPITPLPSMDSWELEEQLRHIERVLAGPKFARGLAGAAEFRLDAPQPLAAAPARSDGTDSPSRWLSFLVWSVLAPGLTAMSCGAALGGWACYDKRWELWQVGLPVLVAGQAALVVGLLLQLCLAWRKGRPVSTPLDADGTPATTPSAATMHDAEHRPVA